MTIIFFFAVLVAMFVSWIMYCYQSDHWHKMTIPSKVVSFCFPAVFWFIAFFLFFWFVV